MKQSIIKEKSFRFAVRIINLYKFLKKEKEEYVISKQLLRCGTSVGALIREAEHAESSMDFIHKLAIAQKEINECNYWLELLKETEFLTENQFTDIYNDSVEIIKLLTAIIKTNKTKD